MKITEIARRTGGAAEAAGNPPVQAHRDGPASTVRLQPGLRPSHNRPSLMAAVQHWWPVPVIVGGVRFPWNILIALGLVLAILLGWVLGPGATWVLIHFDGVSGLTGKDLAAASDAVRGRALTIATGLIALVAVFYTARNADTARRTFQLSEQGQVTDRYTKAIEQLGSDKLDVRLGGIYALERIARDSARDHATVMEVLAAFVREHSRERESTAPIRTDVQAAVTVIARRNSRHDQGPINLRGANLAGADLAGANLTGVDFTDANLVGAALYDALLVNVNLTNADLTEASLYRANLSGANLTGVDFTGATLTEVNLTAAYSLGRPITIDPSLFKGPTVTDSTGVVELADSFETDD
ncbi:pentapeptide repeat-containing protein [Microbispora sp. NPDC049125]|uniref:pentapeptide repeat-containing protein n=1 Tax=Microbispora sp. NPDC049125 TaxID=3154929 RepID=UPI003466C842